MDVNDQGVVGRTPLCLVYFFGHLLGEPVAAKTVDRLGGEDHQSPFSEDAGGLFELYFGFCRICDPLDLGLHRCYVSCCFNFSAVSASVRASNMAEMLPFMKEGRSYME